MLIGIDGGGSNARLGLFNRNLECLENIESPESLNPSNLGLSECFHRLEYLLNQLLQKRNVQHKDIQSISWGIAGAEKHQQTFLKWFHRIFPQAQLTGVPDFEIALVGGLGRTTGLLLLSGTGSVAYGKNHLGLTKRVGGWGWFLGDEGSGFWIGQEALRIVVKAHDQQIHHFPLCDAIYNYFDVSNSQELLEFIYLKSIEPKLIAQLAPIVIEFSQKQDPFALDILHRAAYELYQLFVAVSVPLGLSKQDTVFVGGVLTRPSPLRDQLQKYLKLSHPALPLNSPLTGAAILAVKALEK